MNATGSPEPSEQNEVAQAGVDPNNLRAFYAAGNQRHIENDRATWQVASIFFPTSALIGAWVTSQFPKTELQFIQVVTAAATGIGLVSLATLFKRRLRGYNKRLEQEYF